jgi:DHA1 family bicyclomycin/chloramphenicol resistance-like MFS transporter
MTLVIAVSPMIAPTIGGYMTSAVGWHSVFIILAVITFIILVCTFYFLPHGKRADKSISLAPASVIRNFYSVIKQPQFLIYTLAGGLASAAPFAYIAGSPDVFMNIYHVTEKQYGWIFAIVAGIMIGATQLNHILLKKFTSQQIIKITFFFQSIVGLLFVTGTLLGWYNVFEFVGMVTLFVAGHGLINPNATALSLAPFAKHAGSAASLAGSFRMAMGGVASALVSALHNGTAIPMVAVMVGCSACGFLCLGIGKTSVLYAARKSKDEAEEPSVFL